MPHAVFNLGSQTATGDLAARNLIPGIEPGGSRAGRDTKPALLIRDAWIEVNDVTIVGAANDFNGFQIYLKLSQELDLTPGLILPIAAVGMERAESTAVGFASVGIDSMVREMFRAQGTVWVPRVVGIRLLESGTATLDADVHLDYERIELPWMEWFLEWEFLDGVIDNEREY